MTEQPAPKVTHSMPAAQEHRHTRTTDCPCNPAQEHVIWHRALPTLRSDR